MKLQDESYPGCADVVCQPDDKEYTGRTNAGNLPGKLAAASSYISPLFFRALFGHAFEAGLPQFQPMCAVWRGSGQFVAAQVVEFDDQFCTLCGCHIVTPDEDERNTGWTF